MHERDDFFQWQADDVLHSFSCNVEHCAVRSLSLVALGGIVMELSSSGEYSYE